MRWEGSFGIISSRSVTHDRKNCVQLWGRTSDGESICLLVEGMEPWFEIGPLGVWEGQISHLENALDLVKKMDEVIRLEGPVEKWTDLGMKPIWKVVVKHPAVVPRVRKELMSSWNLYSGDIPFANRILLDGDFGIHARASAEIISRSDFCDLYVRCQWQDISSTEPFSVPWVVMSFDLETSIEDGRILCAAAVVEDLSNNNRVEFVSSGKEEDIMAELTTFVTEHDPDIITGYNIDNFDMQRLQDRIRIHASKNDWEKRISLLGWGRLPITKEEHDRSRDGLLPYRGNARAWSLAGRCVMDAWWQARQALRPERETLSFVTKLLFPGDEEKQKIGIDASKMDEEWAKRPDEVIEYCLRDAALPLDIMEEIQAIRRCEAIASVAGVTLDVVANGNTSQRLDALVIRAADKNKIAVPLTGSADRKEGQIQGGYVHDVEAGLHPWIAILDFKSMYPSIMIAHNICYTTRIDSASTDQPQPQESIHVSPTGASFRNAEERKGLVPSLLEQLMAKRDYHKTSFSASSTHSEKQFHDQMQYAVKIMMNTFYGVFASGFYRFTHRDLGTSITAWARHNIKQIINKLEQEGHPVVYSDTDSIFVKAPVEGNAQPLDTMVEFAQNIAQRFSEDGAILEFEKGLSAFFSHGAKKRYVGQVVWPENSMIIKGYETQRTDSFSYLGKGMKRLFEHILKGDEKAAIIMALESIESVKSGQVPPEDLIISKSCKGKWNKTLEQWEFHHNYSNPDSMAQVAAAKQIIEKGLPFTPGMKISFLVQNAQKSPMLVRAWFQEERESYTYDSTFYAERLATAFGRVTEAFGWNAKDLFRGSRQTSLFSF